MTGRRVTTTFTDRSGKFAVGQLAPGTYVINVEELGCEPIQQRVRVDFNSMLNQNLHSAHYSATNRDSVKPNSFLRRVWSLMTLPG